MICIEVIVADESEYRDFWRNSTCIFSLACRSVKAGERDVSCVVMLALKASAVYLMGHEASLWIFLLGESRLLVARPCDALSVLKLDT